MGHSSGKIAAAIAAGALTIKSCMVLAFHRGRIASLISRRGAMLAPGASQNEVQALVQNIKNGTAAVACFNGPSLITVSGDENAILELQQLAKDRGIFARRLKVDVAYHSYHMEEIVEDYLKAIKTIEVRSRDDSVKYFSSLEGQRTQLKTLDARYWCQNMTNPVQFHQAMQAMCANGHNNSVEAIDMLIETGPHSSLKTPIHEILHDNKIWGPNIKYLPSLCRDQDANIDILRLAPALFATGYDVDIPAINSIQAAQEGEGTLLCDLPSYSWIH